MPIRFSNTVFTRDTCITVRMALGAAALLSLVACANLHTINRSTDLPNNGKAITSIRPSA